MADTVQFNRSLLTIEDVDALAKRAKRPALSSEAAFVASIEKGAAFLETLLKEDGIVYGVNTGYGDSCTVAIPASLVDQLPHQLYTYHGVGLGPDFGAEETRAILAARLASLCRGVSAVSYPLLKQLEQLLAHDLLPRVPQEGSVGASGDLTPLSYVAAALCGDREVFDNGKLRPSAEALASRGLKPLRLKPKEGLAIMNGTAVMTGLACLAWMRAEYLCRLATRATGWAVLATSGNPHHFNEKLFEAKPHPGQARVAARLRADLQAGLPTRNERRLQDRYSLRCAPQVIGVLEDALPFLRAFIENELNSANDNPLLDAEAGMVMHGGHFYGGHIAFAMDSMKAAVASVADLMDRQVALLCDPKFNHGLPANLSGASRERAPINHGLKALTISASAWAAEALKQTMPAASFSRSTECHNQDKVSMGTIAARDCLRVLELSEQVVVSALLTSAQGLELRLREDGDTLDSLTPESRAMFEALRQDTPFLEEDRALEAELRRMLERTRARAYPAYAAEGRP